MMCVGDAKHNTAKSGDFAEPQNFGARPRLAGAPGLWQYSAAPIHFRSFALRFSCGALRGTAASPWRRVRQQNQVRFSGKAAGCFWDFGDFSDRKGTAVRPVFL